MQEEEGRSKGRGRSRNKRRGRKERGMRGGAGALSGCAGDLWKLMVKGRAQSGTSPFCAVRLRCWHQTCLLSLAGLKQAWIKRLWATLCSWPLSPSSVWSRTVREALPQGEWWCWKPGTHRFVCTMHSSVFTAVYVSVQGWVLFCVGLGFPSLA